MKKKARIKDSRDALRKIDEMKKLIASASRKCDEIPTSLDQFSILGMIDTKESKMMLKNSIWISR